MISKWYLELIPIKAARIGFDPTSPTLQHPADRRRFCYFAKSLDINYELYNPKNKYDLIILTETSDISYWRRSHSDAKIIFNLNDSYLSESLNIKSALRGLAKFISKQNRYLEINYVKALKGMCSRADAVICSTVEQKLKIERFCSNTHIMFDAHFDEVITKKENFISHEPFKLIWEGLPTNTYQLKKLAHILSSSELKNSIELNVVTDKYAYKFLNKFLRFNVKNYIKKFPIATKFHQWSIESIQEVSKNSDLAVIPIDINDPMMVGKPENKLLLFWRMGMPTLVADTPSYRAVMKAVNQNYLIKEDNDWEYLIKELMSSRANREKAAKDGLDYLNKNYTKKEFYSRWELLLNSLGFSL